MRYGDALEAAIAACAPRQAGCSRLRRGGDGPGKRPRWGGGARMDDVVIVTRHRAARPGKSSAVLGEPRARKSRPPRGDRRAIGIRARRYGLVAAEGTGQIIGAGVEQRVLTFDDSLSPAGCSVTVLVDAAKSRKRREERHGDFEVTASVRQPRGWLATCSRHAGTAPRHQSSDGDRQGAAGAWVASSGGTLRCEHAQALDDLAIGSSTVRAKSSRQRLGGKTAPRSDFTALERCGRAVHRP